ncbi:MAG TPA: hypothetical protein VHX87_04190 [Galbitalea sp.]|nr:hypothetical protein [Galbitalea sp.]
MVLDRMNRRILRVAAVVTAAILLVVGGSGVAYAYWSAGGIGAAIGGTGTTVPITLSAGTPTAGLVPGSNSSVVLVATNTNLATVHVSTLSLDTTQGTSGLSVDAAHTGCSLSSLSFTTQTNGGAGWDVPGKVGAVNGSLSVSLASALTMATSAANACQGATFTIYLLAG